METILDVLKAKKRFQWEANSGTPEHSQSNNCGPTCASMIAGFYNDNHPGIERTRTNAGVPCCRGTTYHEQERMFENRKVGATVVNITSLSQLRDITKNHRRPVTLAVQMGRIPAAYRGHPFEGWHAIVCMAPGTHNGEDGFWINDPNFSPPGGVRPDPSHGKRFYPNWVLQQGFINNSQHWAIVPNKSKKIMLEFDQGTDGVVIRTAPRDGKDVEWGEARKDGIYHNGKRMAGLYHNFEYRAIDTDKDGHKYWRVREFGRTLYIRKKFMHPL